MNANTFGDKVLELIMNDNLDDAIILLSKLSHGNQWMKEVVLHSAQHKDIERQIRYGTQSYGEISIAKNRIRISLIDIVNQIKNSNDNSLNSRIQLLSNQDKYSELLEVLEIIYESTHEILLENQKILSPIFTDNYSKEELYSKMVLLFHNQKKRGSFFRWCEYLYNLVDEDYFSPDTNEIIENISIDLELYSKAIYHEISDEFTIENMKKLISSLDENFVFEKFNKFSISIFLKPSNNVSNSEIKKYVKPYLDHLREFEVFLGTNIEKLKSRR